MRRWVMWLVVGALFLLQAVSTTGSLMASTSGRPQALAVAARVQAASHPGDIWAPQ